MNTNKLKSFAKRARKLLLQGVQNRLIYWGFDENGNILEELKSTKGGYVFRGEVFDDPDVPKKWEALKQAIHHHTAQDIIEEAAYTWFNRLIAIKILEKNNYVSPVVSYVSENLTEPQILYDARKSKIEYLVGKDKEKLIRYLISPDDESAFAVLLINYCRGNNLLNNVFGSIDDYTELLLPSNLLSNDGIINFINTTDAITGDDYKELELIGWLYQFYISDKKDEVFAGFKKNKKARAEDIPAATQIFTPKWIVKYLVENTVGRIWLDLHPCSPIREKMKYLVEPSEKNPQADEPIIKEVSELKVLDPAVGSGHFLLVAFDLLLEMYKEEGYTPRNAVEQILKNNLFGLDICKRAVQLANFALLLKATEYDPDILSRDLKPNVYFMPEPRDFSRQDIYDFLGEEGKQYTEELEIALKEMQQAQNIGSALKLDLSRTAHDYIGGRLVTLKEQQLQGQLDLAWQSFITIIYPFIDPLLLLSDRFHAVVTNPPYMGGKSMNADLSKYVKANYPMGKADLLAVFMEVCNAFNINNGLIGMINQHSWMFLSSFEDLRKKSIANYIIKSMLHLGPRVFDELSGEVVQSTSFVLKKEKGKDYRGDYFRLVDYKSSAEKEKKFIAKEHHYRHLKQSDFEKIPGVPIAYWVSETLLKSFNGSHILESIAPIRQGFQTGDNERFLRYWFEVDFNKIKLNAQNTLEAHLSGKKWFPYNKGGKFRKWFGNNEFLVAFDKHNYNLLLKLGNRLPSRHLYFREGITWSSLSSGSFGARLSPKGFTFSAKGACAFPRTKDKLTVLSFLNSKVANEIFQFFSATMDFNVGNIRMLPFRNLTQEKNSVDAISENCIMIAKNDWDSTEISWDFKSHMLIDSNFSIRNSFNKLKIKTHNNFFKLLNNEKELNQIFIRIYNLENELKPDVHLKDITILDDLLDYDGFGEIEEVFHKNGKESIELPLKTDVIISQFLSYATGCIMGRYRLDKPWVNIAHPDPTSEEISSYVYKGQKVEIDEDAIIPMMGSDSPFSDDIVIRVKDFVLILWGEETLTENLNFINEALGMDMEKFMVSKFWDFHKKMYKKKPIYWLFASPNKTFQVLVYMHRMNRFTVQKIRNNYLLKYLNYLNEQIQKLEKNEASLSRNEVKRLDDLRKAQIECREYDRLVKDYADRQIEFDLDDGVTVNHAKFKGIVVEI